MLDIKFIRQNPEKVKEGIAKKRADVDIDRLLGLDEEKRQLLAQSESLRAEQKKLGKEQIEKAQAVKAEIKNIDPKLAEIEKELDSLLRQIPNLPLDEVPEGKDDSENAVLREEGKKPEFDFKPKDYLEIAEALDLIDVKRAAKVAGSRFGYLKKEAVLMEFALVNLALETLSEEGFYSSRAAGNAKARNDASDGLYGTGGDEIYFLEKDNLYLIGTSEQSIGAMHAGDVFKEEELPKRYAGFSTCFRREAGAYGKDTKGILRVHQFDKVEMFSFCSPEKSKEEHQLLLRMEEKLMQSLKLPYRVINICSGDLGDPAAAKYDIEAWMPGQGRVSGDPFDFKLHGLAGEALKREIPKRGETGKLEFVHTLNGTAFAIGRMLIAIIENYQKKDGSVEVPKVLQKYLGIKKIG